MTQQPLFQLGNCYMTPGINTLVAQQALSIDHYLYRHQHGDWGDITKEDGAENETSLLQGYRILSAYNLEGHTGSNTIKIWIITEADRSTTTVLLPNE